MNVKKRKKNTRHRGTHTHSRGAKKKARGKGHRGGIGNAGSGKRADHKKVLKVAGKKYFGKRTTLRAPKREIVKTMSLRTISENIPTLVAKKIATGKGDSYEVTLKNFKIIGTDIGELKLTIHAKAATKGAQEAVKKAGGEIILELTQKKAETKEKVAE